MRPGHESAPGVCGLRRFGACRTPAVGPTGYLANGVVWLTRGCREQAGPGEQPWPFAGLSGAAETTAMARGLWGLLPLCRNRQVA